MKLYLRLAVLCLALAPVAADWPQLLGPSRNGTSTETGLVDTWPRKGPPVVWQRPVGEGYASPVVAARHGRTNHRVRVRDGSMIQSDVPNRCMLRPTSGKRALR